MATPCSCATWRHEGWAALVGWITRRVPDCDPTVPAIHAVRRAPLVRQNPLAARHVAGYVLGAAQRAPAERRRIVELSLKGDPEDFLHLGREVPESLAGEAAELFGLCGLHTSAETWGSIAAGIDIAADWWDRYASQSGLTGETLVAAARDAAAMSSAWRLRRHLHGPASRPLVALLLGGDQWGRRARRACGCEASLVVWALGLRRARRACEAAPTPPPPVVGAWATTVGLIETALARAGGRGAGVGPTVAA